MSLFVSHYRAGKFENSEFDRSLGKHDAFLIVDRFIFVQVQWYNYVRITHLHTTHMQFAT